jgi:hypothetical protein
MRKDTELIKNKQNYHQRKAQDPRTSLQKSTKHFRRININVFESSKNLKNGNISNLISVLC